MILPTRENFNNPFTALKNRQFRIYWTGLCISQMGTWMQNIAQPWLAYMLTKSPLLLSLVGTLQFAPVLLFSLFAGTLIDRFSRKKMIIMTQTAALLITSILAVLVWTDLVQYWHILVMAAALGLVNTLDIPARQAFLIELVEKKDLINAIALNSSIFNLARIIAPALAGIVMGYAGIAFCFFANSLSFAAVLVSLFFIEPKVIQIDTEIRGTVFSEIKEGLQYIFKQKILSDTLLAAAIIGTFAFNFNVLLPVYAQQVLHQQETGFGILMSFIGVGSFIGAIFVATISGSEPNKVLLRAVPLMISLLLIMIDLQNSKIFTILCFGAIGFFFVTFTSLANSVIQINTAHKYRGRAMSVYSLVNGGSLAIGNIFAGIVTQYYGPKNGFAACGVMILILYSVRVFTSKRKMIKSKLTETKNKE